MRTKIIIGTAVALALLAGAAAIPLKVSGNVEAQPVVMAAPAPKAPAYTPEYLAALEVAKVYGRAPACATADADQIQATAKASLAAGLDSALAAATVATESGCDPLAISKSEAVGEMQVMPRIWKAKYDFTGKVNLLNRDDNLRVGTEILAGLVKQYGNAGGLARYQGMDTTSPAYDPAYIGKILTLAGKR